MNDLPAIAKRLRYEVLTSTTKAGSGHPTSCLSAVELMTTLMFGGYFCADLDHPDYHNNDRLIFSKGHAAPLLYALYALAGKLSPQYLQTLRSFTSNLQGHPMRDFPYTEVPTGSLGQGLSVGFGMALGAKYLDKLPFRTFVLLGDSELAEGSNYEAMQLASFYQLDNLIAIVDVNRLGQRGPTMLGHDLDQYQERWQSFGWQVFLVKNGHDFDQLNQTFAQALQDDSSGKPVVILAQTYKGAGIDFLQDQPGWHGKVLNHDQLAQALNILGLVDKHIIGTISAPDFIKQTPIQSIEPQISSPYELNALISPRQAYGDGLLDIANNPDLVVLDAEVSNSTFSSLIHDIDPQRFFEMFIAEQNMVCAAVGLSRLGKIPFISTFGAFFTRAADQLRMAQYADVPLVCVGTHAGISIGPDGVSQMALEDISLFRSLSNSTVLYPCDAQSTRALTAHAYNSSHITYLRLTRNNLPVIYNQDEKFPIGKSKVLRQSLHDQLTIFAAGITVHEALKAYELLQSQNISARIIDLYSVKPLDVEAISWAVRETPHIIIVEDHYPQGGLGEAIFSLLASLQLMPHSKHLAVNIRPRSGTPEELLAFASIDAQAISQAAIQLISQ